MVGILKSHEKEVLKEEKTVPNAGPLSFVTKTEGSKNKASKMIEDNSDSDSTNEEFTSEIKSLMVSNPKKFFKKNFSKFKGNKFNRGDIGVGSFKSQNLGSEKMKEEGYRMYQKEEEKGEKKLLGDSDYDCNYFHGKNH